VTRVAGPIAPGEEVAVSITFTIDPAFTEEEIRNNAEISDDNADEYTDADGNPLSDVDSAADGTYGNDPEGDNDQTDGTGQEGDDEDDQDRDDLSI